MGELAARHRTPDLAAHRDGNAALVTSDFVTSGEYVATHTSLRLTQDCATVCAAAASVVARGGPMQDLICKACADACKRCGDECAKHDTPVMKRCAEVCRRCEAECRKMIAPGGHAGGQ